MRHPKPYIRKKVAEYRAKRRKYAINKLGGKCNVCGSTEQLEFDHIDPTTKISTIAKIWTASKEVFEEELNKCQLLCKKCHKEKTKKEPSLPPWNKNKWEHGSLTGYVGKKCRCDKCRKYYSDYRKLKRRVSS